MTDAAIRAELAAKAAQAGGETAVDSFRTAMCVDTKATKNDLVTRADRAAQRAVIERIRAAFPDDPIVAEEGDKRGTVPETGPAWVIDPIDGTANYVRGLLVWTSGAGRRRTVDERAGQ